MTTIAKVAERAGVSPTTVSHVLNHADRVSQHLRVRVLAAIEELGYVPNSNAQSLRTGRTNMVALLIPDILNAFYTEMVRMAQTELARTGRDIMVFNADVPGGEPQIHSREYLSQIRSKGVDGLIVGDFALHGMYEALSGISVPTVFVGHLPEVGVDNVCAADYEGSFEMGRYLAGKSYRPIAHVTGPPNFPAAMRRREGFRDGVLASGVVETDLIEQTGTYLGPSGEAAIHALHDQTTATMPPRAVHFSNYLMCEGGLAALADRGLSVPDDVAVSVFGRLGSMRYVRPTLTRVGVDPGDLALRAVRMLIDRLDGEKAGDAPRQETVACTFEPGDFGLTRGVPAMLRASADGRFEEAAPRHPAADEWQVWRKRTGFVLEARRASVVRSATAQQVRLEPERPDWHRGPRSRSVQVRLEP